MRNDLLRSLPLHALGFLAAAALAGCAPAETTEMLTDAVPGEAPLAVGQGGVFYTQNPGDSPPTPLARIPLAGGSPTVLDPNAQPSYLAVDGDSVFYGNILFQLPGPPVWSFTIDRVAQAGGAPQTLVSGDGFLNGMAVGGGSVVFTKMDSAPTSALGSPYPDSGAIFVQPIAPLGQAPAAPTAIAEMLPNPCAIAADEARVYWLDCTTKQLLSLPLSAQDGDAPAVLAAGLDISADAGQNGPLLTAAAGRLYWFEGTAVRTLPSTGGTPSTVASEAGWLPAQILADETAVYLMTGENFDAPSGDASDDSQPGVWTMAPAGGPASQVLGPDVSPAALAMDADFLYWIDSDDGSVRRTPR